jgi:hypothetical protein
MHRGGHEHVGVQRATAFFEGFAQPVAVGQVVIFTEQGMAEQEVPFTLQSLYIFLELKLPQARTALNWLRRQREMLGEEDFLHVLQEHLEEEHVQAVLELMEVVVSSAR